MSQVGIEAIATALPDRVVTTEELAHRYGFDEEFITSKLGISARRVLDPDEDLSDLAAKAVRSLLNAQKIEPNEIDLLLVVTQTPDYMIPPMSAIIQDKVDLAQRCLTLDLNLGCSGFVTGIAVAVNYMRAAAMTKGVVVTADAYSRIMDKADRNTSPIFGDAATATLLSTTPKYCVGASTHGTDGTKRDALILHGSGSKIESTQPLIMNGRTVLNFVLQNIPDDVQVCARLNGTSTDEIDAFVFHQANDFMVRSLADRIGVPREKLILEMENVGNTTSSSIPICLESKILSRKELPQRVLLSGFGVGLSWASTILSRVDRS